MHDICYHPQTKRLGKISMVLGCRVSDLKVAMCWGFGRPRGRAFEILDGNLVLSAGVMAHEKLPSWILTI